MVANVAHTMSASDLLWTKQVCIILAVFILEDVDELEEVFVIRRVIRLTRGEKFLKMIFTLSLVFFTEFCHGHYISSAQLHLFGGLTIRPKMV